MSVPQTVAEVLSQHVVLEVESIDRMYLDVYVATARELAVLLRHLWVSGEAYEPLHNSSRMTVAAAA